mgnify:CR=1 FL=1
MYYAEFCAPLKSRATATIYRLYLSAIELLPIWIMFIDRIIDRICFSAVTLSLELLNLAQIEPYCRVVVECASLLAAQNLVIRQNHTAADVFLNYMRYFTMIESMVGFPLLPPPHLLSFFRKHFNISHARCSRVRYQSIHESQITNIS